MTYKNRFLRVFDSQPQESYDLPRFSIGLAVPHPDLKWEIEVTDEKK